MTAALVVPVVGPWLALLLTCVGAWHYQSLVNMGGDPETAPDRPGRGQAIVRVVLSVLGAAVLLAPVLVRNGGDPLPHRPPEFGPWAAWASLVGWLVAPLLLTLTNARDRSGPLGPGSAARALSRHPLATASAVFLLPIGLILLELAVALFAWWEGELPLLVADLFPPPHVEVKYNDTHLIFLYDNLRIDRPFRDEATELFPVYITALGRGFTLLATVPGSIVPRREVVVYPQWFHSDPTVYLAFRVMLSVVILSGIGLLLSMQALLLGRITAIGARRIGTRQLSTPRAAHEHTLPVPEPANDHPSTNGLSDTPSGVTSSEIALPAPANDPFPVPLPSPTSPAMAASPVSVATRPLAEPAQVTGLRDGLPRILLIDDERPFAESLGRVLTARGFTVLVAGDAHEGLRTARNSLPDLIVLDLMLPDRPGVEVCRDLRSDIQTRNIPIIMATYRAGAEDEVKALNLGADDFLVKPYVVDVLIARIQNQLRRRKD